MCEATVQLITTKGPSGLCYIVVLALKVTTPAFSHLSHGIVVCVVNIACIDYSHMLYVAPFSAYSVKGTIVSVCVISLSTARFKAEREGACVSCPWDILCDGCERGRWEGDQSQGLTRAWTGCDNHPLHQLKVLTNLSRVACVLACVHRLFDYVTDSYI